MILLLFQSFSADDVGQSVKNMFYDQLEVTGIKYATKDGDVLLADHLDKITRVCLPVLWQLSAVR